MTQKSLNLDKEKENIKKCLVMCSPNLSYNHIPQGCSKAMDLPSKHLWITGLLHKNAGDSVFIQNFLTYIEGAVTNSIKNLLGLLGWLTYHNLQAL